MRIRRTTLLFLVVLVVGLAPLAFGQFAPHSTLSHPELGFYDRETGAFTPLQPVAQDAEALPPVAPTTGDFVFNITITLKSAIPKNGVIGCSAKANVNESSGFSSTESGFGLATGSGTTRTCSVTIPYSWLLTSASSDSVFLNYEAFIGEGVQINATNGTGNLVEITGRDSKQTLAPIKVPANGATTTETISMTL